VSDAVTLPKPEGLPEDVVAPLEVGDVVAGTYELRALIGTGGMGSVFEAHDRDLNRRVALKASHPNLDPQLLRREAQALAAVRHPGMVTVHAFGIHEGIAFLVMERLYGLDLATHLVRRREAGHPLGIDEALEILVPLAEALSAVHRAGLAHRDVKPANVMLAVGQRVVLMDFGVFTPERAARSNTFSGTAAYMAPETISADVEPGQAYLVDLYAFGVLAYELLAGKRPFQNEGVGKVLHQHLASIPPPMAGARPDVPPALAKLVMEMLEKEPGARPSSMDGVAHRLRALQLAEAPRPPTRPLRALIVDDDLAIARLLAARVKQAAPGVSVRLAGDGEQALSAVAADPPDVVVVDLHMPRMNGVELCMHLHGMRVMEGCTVIATSAGAQPTDVALLGQLGIEHFVPKDGELGATIAALVGKVHARFTGRG